MILSILKTHLLFSLAIASMATPAFADVSQVYELLRTELTKKIPGAQIKFSGDIRWVQGSLPKSISMITVLNENAQGIVQFLAKDEDSLTSSEGYSAYSAWLPAKIATKRVMPGDKIAPENFSTQDVNVAVGNGREFRGLILNDLTIPLEARQTILEGQFLVSSAVQKIPNIRRGDAVQIRIISGDLKLSTSGIAQEAGYTKGQVRVMTQKSKKEISGELKADGSVEVLL